MKFKLLTIGVLAYSLSSHAQIDTLNVNDNKFIRVEFNSDIKVSQISNPQNYFIENKGEFLFIQALDKDLLESNLFVQTSNGNTYDFILKYSNKIDRLNYSYKSNNGNVANSNSLTGISKNNPLEGTRGYIKSRNFTTKGNVSLYVKGVYIQNDYMYFLFDIENKSNIKYELDDIKFFIINEEKLNNTSIEREELTPKFSYEKWGSLNGKEKHTFVIGFEKFTLSNRNLLVEIFEKKGDRNLNLVINHKLIENAKNL